VVNEFSEPTVAYLGPRGTFTEEALFSLDDLKGYRAVPLGSFKEVLERTEAGEFDLGFLPIENSIEGTVLATLDPMVFEHHLLIQREVELEIHQNLLVKPGTERTEIKTIISYSHATAQCANYIKHNLPGVTISTADSTAQAAQIVAESDDHTLAAIGPLVAAQIYGLWVETERIEDFANNKTRFVLLSRTGVPEMTGCDKTSIVCFQLADRPGSLLGILEHFARRSINLSKLESRPAKSVMGEYCFIIDFEGHIRDEPVAECLEAISDSQAGVKFLGSYPRVPVSSLKDIEKNSVSRVGYVGKGWVRELLNPLG
jgi:prephenate dehydratase